MIHIVVVEDDMDIAYLLMSVLNSEDYIDAVHVSTSQAAMDESSWVFNDGSKIMGILDLMLPEADGIKVAAWVRANLHPTIPLLGITAASPVDPDSIFHKAIDSGYFDKVIEKPAHPKKILSYVRDLAYGLD